MWSSIPRSVSRDRSRPEFCGVGLGTRGLGLDLGLEGSVSAVLCGLVMDICHIGASLISRSLICAVIADEVNTRMPVLAQT